MPKSRLGEIEAAKNLMVRKAHRQDRLKAIEELIPKTRLIKPSGSKKVVHQCRILNIGNLFRTSSKSSPHKRCRFSGRQQLLTASLKEPWVWACLKHVRYFLDTIGEITIRNTPDDVARVLRA